MKNMSTDVNDRKGPLQGIRVIDMATILMGPVATQILGDYGADVIKVEPPEGDVSRYAGVGRNPMMGSMYLASGRNKRCIVLDVKAEQGKAALLKLCEGADLFIHNVRPQAMARLGLTYADLRRVNPSIVYVSLVGFGEEGPYANRPAFDDVIQAAAGVSGLFMRAGGDAPGLVPANLVDRMTGMTAAHAAIAALFMRERTGIGQEVQVPMYETFVQTLLGDHLAGEAFIPPVAGMGYSRILNPFRKPFKTADGHVVATPYNNKQYHALFKALDRLAEYEAHPILSKPEARAANYEQTYEYLATVFLEKSTAEWVRLCQQAEVPCSEVKTLERLLDDPHLEAVGFFQESVHPTEGRIREMRPSTTWSAADVSIRTPAPRMGQHTVEVLREAGLSQDHIEGMLRNKSAMADTVDAPSVVPVAQAHAEAASR